MMKNSIPGAPVRWEDHCDRLLAVVCATASPAPLSAVNQAPKAC